MCFSIQNTTINTGYYLHDSTIFVAQVVQRPLAVASPGSMARRSQLCRPQMQVRPKMSIRHLVMTRQSRTRVQQQRCFSQAILHRDAVKIGDLGKIVISWDFMHVNYVSQNLGNPILFVINHVRDKTPNFIGFRVHMRRKLTK